MRKHKYANFLYWMENLFILILAFYPLRHIGQGIDFRDTGYSYANFRYMGVEHMDSMWLFSTYLANVTGNLLMKLPRADTLMGINFYTGLLVSLLALAGYFFCIRKLKMPRVIVFIGEFMAINLCWCPTAVLYNYLTYVFFLGAFILLYCGLTMETVDGAEAGVSESGMAAGAGASGSGRTAGPRESGSGMAAGLRASGSGRKAVSGVSGSGRSAVSGAAKSGRSATPGRQKWYLAGAGVLLGMNVLVRFSNLPEAAMIVAVWAYDVILWMEERRKDRMSESGCPTPQSIAKYRGAALRNRLLRHTGWCLLGYVAVLLLLYGNIHIRYGMGEYVEGIKRLFAMTDNAPDYKAASMIMGVVGDYIENLYWAIRIGVIVAGGVVFFLAAGWLERRLCRLASSDDGKEPKVSSPADGKEPKKLSSAAGKELKVSSSTVGKEGKRPSMRQERAVKFGLQGNGAKVSENGGKFGSELSDRIENYDIPSKIFHVVVRILWVAVSAAMLWWLYKRQFCSMIFYSYDSIRRPCILFLTLTMLIGAIRIFHRGSPKEEKLLSGMLILVIFLTSLGSNNRTFPSWNNLFVAAPYTLWEVWRFLCLGRHRLAGGEGAVSATVQGDSTPRRGASFPWQSLAFPVKTVLVAFLGMCLFQAVGFGAKFVFAESTGIQQTTAYVENNAVLKNIRMQPERAQWMTEISAYVEENGLQGREVILYGEIPALSYYLQMPSAFNPWSDLPSYNLTTMEKDMAQMETEINEKGVEKPIIILENAYALYAESGEGALTAAGIPQGGIENDRKWKLLMDYMERYGYQQGFRNEKFALYQ